jgi:endonuclease/exonuclease/phosphatase family metal-dependent hydrolase
MVPSLSIRLLMRLVCLLVLAAVPAAALTVASYNVENYLVTDRLVDGVYRQAYPKPEQEKAAVRQVIAGIAPDILAIAEMGKRPFLEELQRDLKAEGQDYPHAVVLDAADEARHVALLSKVPFKAVRPHVKVPVTYLGQSDVVRRGVLEVIFATDQGDLSVFVIHLKSKRTERPEDPNGAAQRQAEAEAVRDLVLSLYPDPTKAKFIVCGDWNDARNSKSTRALQKRGDTVVGEILRASDSRGELWTHFYRAEDSYSRIDFLMVSPGLKPLVAGGRGAVYDGPGATGGSDHRAVYAKLNLQPAAR